MARLENVYTLVAGAIAGPGTISVDFTLAFITALATTGARQVIAIGDPDNGDIIAPVMATPPVGTEGAVSTWALEAAPNSSGLIRRTSVTTVTKITQDSPSPTRRRIHISVGGNNIYIGFSNGVTNTTGHPLIAGTELEMTLGPGLTLYAVTIDGVLESDVSVLELG